MTIRNGTLYRNWKRDTTVSKYARFTKPTLCLIFSTEPIITKFYTVKFKIKSNLTNTGENGLWAGKTMKIARSQTILNRKYRNIFFDCKFTRNIKYKFHSNILSSKCKNSVFQSKWEAKVKQEPFVNRIIFTIKLNFPKLINAHKYLL